MRSRSEPLGRILVRLGVVGERGIADALAHSSGLLRLGSACHVLGLADEEPLARALSKQSGMPAVVLERSVIELAVLHGLSTELLLANNILPLHEDATRLVVAIDDPTAAREALRGLEALRGKAVLPHIALRVTLARALRECLRGVAAGEHYWVGGRVGAGARGHGASLAVVSDVDGVDVTASDMPDALIEDVTKEVDLALLPDEDFDSISRHPVEPSREQPTERSAEESWSSGGGSLLPGSTGRITPVSMYGLASDGQDDAHPAIILDDDNDDTLSEPLAREGPPRVLIVDDDFATRHLLVKELQPTGYLTLTASTGTEAVRAIRTEMPDLVVIDVMLPEIDGFQVCRAIKDSRRFGHIPVILMSAVIDSGRLTPEVLARYGVDAYFEKPLNTDKVRYRIRQLLSGRGGPPMPRDDSFERAIALYKGGELDGAIEVLRSGLETEPMSAKHHFVLANLLQKKSQLHEAIDEYEATIDLKPDYFPALTRLAYLYYRKGYAAKAIETWQRSLPLCVDPGLRQNIELFMRKLIAEMHGEARMG